MNLHFLTTCCQIKPDKGLNPDKSEITNLKHHLILKLGQINLKFQYSMTETFTTDVSNPFVNPDLSAMIPLWKTAEGSFVWDFEFGSLEFV
jgi:hypothetical protein